MNLKTRTIVYTFVSLFCLTGGFIGYTFLSIPDVSSLAYTNPVSSKFMEYRQTEAALYGRPLHLRHSWIPIDSLPKILQRTIVVSEDAAFWIHSGIDTFEIRKAFERNIEEGRFVRGASTITQQTAKNLYLTPEKSLFRKVKELLITFQLEENLSKTRILELYLNLIEFGDGVFGIDSASRFYFGKSPENLSIDEIVRLAAIIPNPLNLNPVKPSTELRWRSRIILDRLGKYGFISDPEYHQARAALGSFFEPLE